MIREELTKSYTQRKSQGLVFVSKVETSPDAEDQTQYYTLAQRRFSSVDGTEMDPRLYYFTLEELSQIKSGVQSWIADIDLMKADAEAL